MHLSTISIDHLKKYRTAFLIICISLIFLFLRNKYHLSALETDEGSYAYMAQELLRGNFPYVNFFDHKPIVIYLIYALIIKLFGVNTVAIKACATTAVILSSLITYKVARIVLSPMNALIVYILSLFSLSLPFIQASTANTEIFMLFFIMSGIYIILTKRGYLWDMAAGILIGSAILTKTVAVSNLFAIMAFLIWQREYKRILSLTIGTGITVSFPLLTYYAIGGREYVNDYWFANFTYNSLYLRQLRFPIRIFNFPIGIITENIAVWLLGITAAIYTLFHRKEITLLLISLNLLIGILLIQYIGRGSPHYYIQLIPFLSLLTIALISGINKIQIRSALTSILIASAIISIFNYKSIVLNTRTDQLLAPIFQTYGRGKWYDNSVFLSTRLSQYVNPGDFIYNLGRESQIYFYTQTRSSSKYYYDRPVWLAPETMNTICSDLRRNKPKIVVDTLQPPYFTGPIWEQFRQKIFQCSNLKVTREEKIDFSTIYFIK